MKRRIVTVQGVLSMLAVLAGLHHQRNCGEPEHEDHLVLHRQYMPPPYYEWGLQAILRLAEMWRWRGIHHLADIGNKDFEDPAIATAHVHDRLGRNVDVVFAVRNFQASNQRILSAYPNARRICYGDAFGQFDSFDHPDYPAFHEGLFLLPHQCVRSHASGVPAAPIDQLPFTKVAKEAMLDVINGYCERDLFLRHTLELIKSPRPRAVALLGNHTETGFFKERTLEFTHYTTTAMGMGLQHFHVLIKRHPREHMGHGEAVSKVFQHFGIESEELAPSGYLASLPIEILFPLLKPALVANLGGSVASMSLGYLFGFRDHDGWGTGPMVGRNSEHRIHEDLVRLYIRERVHSWDEKGVLYSPFSFPPLSTSGATLPP